MNKLVIVINGRGGVGKDTLCDFVAKKYSTMNISSIDDIKKIASEFGWDGVKDEKGRKLLSDIKNALLSYNPDYCNDRLIDLLKDFYVSNHDIMFVHIREPKEIEKFELAAKKVHTIGNNVKIIDILIKREEIDAGKGHYGNSADDNVWNYDYDYIYHNNFPLDRAEEDFLYFLAAIYADEFAM